MLESSSLKTTEDLADPLLSSSPTIEPSLLLSGESKIEGGMFSSTKFSLSDMAFLRGESLCPELATVVASSSETTVSVGTERQMYSWTNRKPSCIYK